MLEAILAGLGADRASSWMLGDSRADLEAGRTARMQTGLVFRSDRCELCPLRGGPPGSPDVHGKTFDELARAVVLRAG
jgi:D-glycero-D-manno-heptose 1,7-bisphosphate phosphatase